MNKKIFEEYAGLKAEEKKISDRLEELKPIIVEEMGKEDADKVELAQVGSFTLGTQARWKFSKAVEELQEKEKASGVATQTVSTVLRFTRNKD